MIVVLAGGTGAAKFLAGLVEILAEELVVIGNVGDDFEHWGLHISPDLDTLTYGLAGLLDESKGWGLAGDSFRLLDFMRRYGLETWFNLGDCDLATHIYRTFLLRQGLSLSQVTEAIGRALGARARILPATDDPVRTLIDTPAGRLSFQEFFVKRAFRDEVTAVSYQGAEEARPAAGVVEALARARGIIIAPSNPVTSIGPILSVRAIRRALAERRSPAAAISPIVGGAAVSGPAAKLMAAIGCEPSAAGVARLYRGLIDVLIIDGRDAALSREVEESGARAVIADIIMSGREGRAALARTVLNALQLK